MMADPVNDEADVFLVTDAEWRAAIQARLDDLGLTYEQLRDIHRRGIGETPAQIKLWMLIGSRTDMDECYMEVMDGSRYQELTSAVKRDDEPPAKDAYRPRRFKRR